LAKIAVHARVLQNSRFRRLYDIIRFSAKFNASTWTTRHVPGGDRVPGARKNNTIARVLVETVGKFKFRERQLNVP